MFLVTNNQHVYLFYYSDVGYFTNNFGPFHLYLNEDYIFFFFVPESNMHASINLAHKEHVESLIIDFLYFDLIAGRNGRGRRLSDQNCWLKLEIIRPYRECSHPRISTTRVYQAPWTARQRPQPLLPCTAVCTGLRPHRIHLSRDRSSPECSFTAWGPGDNRH